MSDRQGVAIRDATPDDRDAIARLTLRAYEEYATVMEPTAWAGLRGAVLGALDSIAEHERIVAEIDGEIVGSVLLFPAAVASYGRGVPALPWPEVRMLAVAPEARGQGVARALMDECVRRATAGGAQRLGIHTSRSMRAALDLYRKMGFERAPDHDFHPPGSEHVEAYTLTLPRA